MVVHDRPKTPKNTSFGGSPSLQGSYSPYILGDTTRPGHVTYVLVWSKSDRRRLRKTLHKQTNRQTDIQTLQKWTNKCRTWFAISTLARIRRTYEGVNANGRVYLGGDEMFVDRTKITHTQHTHTHTHTWTHWQPQWFNCRPLPLKPVA